MRKYDFVIIGAGILGLTIAKELTDRYPSAKIAILEKEKMIGMHASGRNSGVLHSGIYYPQDSLKAHVCSEGAKRMMQFADDHKIAYKKTGKVIIATNENEFPAIDHLLANARKNNIQALLLDEKSVKEHEPHANTYQKGILTPDTACIDSKSVLLNLLHIIQSRHVSIFYNAHVTSIAQNIITTKSKQKFTFGFLFNCAGAGTDKIAKMFDLAKDYALVPFKGIYYKLHPQKSHMVNSNIYPVPDLNLPFLGVHFTKTITNDVYVGPTAIPAFGRENYGLLQGVTYEALRIVKDLSLMYIANQQNFRKLIHSEIKKYSKTFFMQSAKKLIRDIHPQDLLPSNKVGIRPQLINTKKRKIEMDYIIEQDDKSMHILNAISPAFTGSFRFAELIVDRLNRN